MELLQEEMCCILSFLMWQAEWWEKQSRFKPDADAEVADGLSAYGLRQAALRRSLHERCQFAWRNVPEFLNVYNVSLDSEECNVMSEP